MAERPEDLNLPNAVIGRIIKDALPEGVNVSKDARLAMSKAASVFVLYATSCANTFTVQHKRKTISGQDVLEAMSEMEFEEFVEPLKKSLDAFKKGQQGKKDAAEKKRKAKDQDASKDEGKEGEDEDAEEGEEDGHEEEEVEEEEEEDGDQNGETVTEEQEES